MNKNHPHFGLRWIGIGLSCWALTATAGAPKVDDWVTEFTGSPLYPSQLGEPGWPGMVAGQSSSNQWGYPERLPYPGSVEHVRVGYQRYVPVAPLYNAKTLVKNFLAADLPDLAPIRVIDYAEPIYSVEKYAIGKTTGQFNRPVTVVRWDKTHPPIELNFGKLEIGTYVVRVIAATPTENVTQASQRLIINFDINDGITNIVSHYRKRTAAIDEFYSIAEFFFHVWEAHEYQIKLWIDDSTVLPVVYLHNIDLHNKLAQLAGQSGKKSASLYDATERLERWKEQGTYKPDPRSRDQRLAEDQKIWNTGLAINAPFVIGMSEPYSYFMRSAQCLAALAPAPMTDDGLGIDLYGKDMLWNRPKDYIAALKDPQSKSHCDYWVIDPALDAVRKFPDLTRQTAYPAASAAYYAFRQPFLKTVELAAQYHETGDEAKARQAAIWLARLGLQSPTHGSRQAIDATDLIPQFFHSDMAFRHRTKEMVYALAMAGIYSENGFITSYDYLFPFIQDNQELADSLRRFIPWIQTPADVVRFYDTYVLQYYAHQIMTYNMYVDNGAEAWMSNVIAVQQDPTICKPWVEWLFHYVWNYPNKRTMGLDELAVNSVNRDGSSSIGSTAYAGGGGFIGPMMKVLKNYVKNGGVLPVDMTDPERFPKASFGERFAHDIMVAGGYSFWIGDVSGPDRQRLAGDRKLLKTPDQIPNNPSRVLSCWGGILETGREFPDFRQRRAIGIRVGAGYGHAHNDPLDLQIWSQGVPMCGDGGGRADDGYGYPATAWIGNHNTVIANAAAGHRWISSFAPLAGAQYLMGRVLNTNLYARQVVLVDVDTTNSYVVDVFRVDGDDRPTYAFHGMPADQFEVNVANKKKDPTVDKFPLTEDTKWSGTAPSPLVATWRMRRDPEKVAMLLPSGSPGEVKFHGAERKALGPDFDEKSPRKFIRLHLLGQAGADAYGARAVCLKGEPYTNENLYLKPKPTTGKTLFAAVYEPYAGEPFIQSVRLLTSEKSLTDSLAPVAFEVTLINGRRDIIYLAPREAGETLVPGAGTFQGEYALVSYDAAGVRQAALAGGTKLAATGISITTETPAYTGTIRSIDYRKRTAEFSNPLPPEAANAVLEIGPDHRPTSYALTQANGTKVQFLQGMDFAMSRVAEITTDGLQQPDALSQAASWRLDPHTPVEQPVLRTPLNVIPGMTVTDDRGQAYWKWAPEATKTNLVLAGATAPQSVLKEGDAVWVWEIGPGDPYRLPVQVNVVRQADGQYKTTANAPVKVRTGN